MVPAGRPGEVQVIVPRAVFVLQPLNCRASLPVVPVVASPVLEVELHDLVTDFAVLIVTRPPLPLWALGGEMLSAEAPTAEMDANATEATSVTPNAAKNLLNDRDLLIILLRTPFPRHILGIGFVERTALGALPGASWLASGVVF